ncbi:MAG: heme oxygenase [Magnetovibrio sp.]|nr:heme oxygenase [Magnetovibrio sp.]|tara:strand:- start:1834 stop:2709 length:876 start_codon:yes stop_codon:yes gene_type:complete
MLICLFIKILLGHIMNFPLDRINALQFKLNNHKLISGDLIDNIYDLQIFMEHHVFAVWDFMSLIKFLQNHFCPTTDCWVPLNRSKKENRCARLVNEIILAEETDYDLNGKDIVSHFELYLDAMEEIGADVKQINNWISRLSQGSISAASYSNFYMTKSSFSKSGIMPEASANFVKSTFNHIKTGKPNIIAAVFAFGRERAIPDMFKGLISQLDISEIDCPKFHYYLSRHIEIDADEHGPASLELVEYACNQQSELIIEAENAAISAIVSRLKFWDALAFTIEKRKINLKAS